MSKLITSDSEFSSQQKSVLSFIVNMMIPAEGELPAATDNDIFPGILEQLGENLPAANEIVSVVNTLSRQNFSSEFDSLSKSERESVINGFRSSQSELVKFIQVCVVACYYKDARVMRSLGLEARAPHPGGYVVPETDWSLLDPVRELDKIYRSV